MTRLIVRKSGIAGRGVFASERIFRGETIAIMRGKYIYFCATSKKDSMLYPSRVGIGKDLWLELNKLQCVRYMNHSCNPNAGIRGRVTFVALRDIDRGEEITFDYSISEDSKWELKCLCGEKKCRGIIRGIRHLPKSTFDSYMPFIPKYFQKVYRNSHPDFFRKALELV